MQRAHPRQHRLVRLLEWLNVSRSEPRLLLLLLIVFLLGSAVAERPADPEATYWVYVGAESADYVHRIRFGPDGAAVEKQTVVSERWSEIDGPHGLAIDAAGEYLYVSTGHGFPDGKLWKIELGPDRIVDGPLELGRFPATLDVTPDGDYAFIVNFNLHGEHVPSTVSVVYLPEFEEVAQTEVGVMPHGSRISSDGRYQYSGLMMEDQIVELSTRTFQVNRRFDVSSGSEGPLPAERSGAQQPGAMTMEPSCSPTWVQPSNAGDHVYVACNAADYVLEIDTRDWEVSRRFETGRGPYNLDLTPEDDILVVTLKQGDGVEFIDLETGERRAQRASSTTVTHGVVTSPDGRYAFVSVEGVQDEPGKVDIYELDTFQRVAEVEVKQQASGIAFWKMEQLE